MAENQKTFVKWLMIIGFILIVLVLISMWLGYGQLSNNQGENVGMTLTVKIIVTIVALLLILLSYWQYIHQKNLDLKNVNSRKR
ncbi:MAG: hypothetical protein ABIH72_00545 [archaeon]